ncbi:MAG: XdhC family protein [marine benthic group bacterium]|nr:XdhC family protein [Gemmatimonadota bacterium]
MSLPEIRAAVLDWSGRNQSWGEAMLISVKRSAPRLPGARYAVGEDGSFAGTISAGCVEADMREHILSLLSGSGAAEARVITYGISDELALGVGLACGGEIEVLIRRHEAVDPVWTELVEGLGDEADPHAQTALVTGLSEETLGRQALVRADGMIAGSLGPESLDQEVIANFDRLFAREGSEALTLASGHRVFVDRILPPRRLVVVGATPIAVALVELASRVGYRVTVVDPREGLARPSLFPDAELLVEWPAEAFREMDVAAWTDIAVLAHDDRLDLPALSAAVAAGCRYIGLLGGRRTQKARRDALLAAGVPASGLQRIRGPIGLDIGAATPQEIAVSILAEMIATRRLGEAAP